MKKQTLLVSILALTALIAACAITLDKTRGPDAPPPQTMAEQAPQEPNIDVPPPEQVPDIDPNARLFDSAEKTRDIDPALLSPDFKPEGETGLSLAGFVTLLKAQGGETIPDLQDGSVIWTTGQGTFRTVPKSDFPVGDDHYLVFDSLKQEQDGSYQDCHGCSGDLSVIRYSGNSGQPVISKIWNHVSKSGTFGDSGTVLPVSYKDGRQGFVVAGGGTWQGESVTWLSAYVIEGDAISEIKALNRTNPPKP